MITTTHMSDDEMVNMVTLLCLFRCTLSTTSHNGQQLIFQRICLAGTASEIDVSIAFVLYAGTSMSFSLVFGPLIPRFGINAFYFFGLSLVALTNVALGALDLLPLPSYRTYIFAQCVVGTSAMNLSLFFQLPRTTLICH